MGYFKKNIRNLWDEIPVSNDNIAKQKDEEKLLCLKVCLLRTEADIDLIIEVNMPKLIK